MTQYRLLPCPFCGKPPVNLEAGERGRGLMIQCISHGCVNPNVSYYEHDIAIRAWNTRGGRVDGEFGQQEPKP